ncbi:MAG: hypothetical protein K9G33_06150 [Sneathiella sp.]|nr:hypothetical protein [Sneathiella sp.]
MSSLFSTALQNMNKNLPVALGSVFKTSRRQVHFQDVLFGMESERNLERMIKLEKSGGPSMIMNALTYGIQAPFITDPKSIQGNDDTTRVFGLNRLKIVPLEYSAFPTGVLKNVKTRNGLFEVSFQYDGKRGQWNPERLLEYLGQNDLSALKKIASHTLFESFLKKRNASDDEIANMYAAVYRKNISSLTDQDDIDFLSGSFQNNDPEQDLRPEKRKELCDAVKNADEKLPSFTDIEFGLFFLNLDPSERYNMACLLQGGHLIKTEEVAANLQELLKLKKANNKEKYAQMLSDFMEATKGNIETMPRSELIINSFRQLPLIDLIFRQNSDFMARNFEALCVKIDAYLLNLVRPSEKLVVNLQFPFVFDGAPAFITLLVGVGENNIIKVEELMTDASDPLSLTARTVDPRLANSLKYCGTPSANICILENPKEMETKFIEASKALWKLNKDETSANQIFINRLNCLFSVFSDPAVELRYLSGNRLVVSSKDKDWDNICRAINGTGFLNSQYRIKANPIKTVTVDNGWYDGYDGVWISDEVENADKTAVENYDWRPILTVELSEKFKIEKAKTLNELPSGFPEPVAYPEHIGAASPLNPMSDTGELLSEESFNKLVR